MPSTIKDIAKKLNLSVSTVSYALNGGPKPVSAEVRDRVHLTARELGYRPNRVARSLVTRRNHTVGVVPVDLSPDILLNPYISVVLNGLLNEVSALRQDMLLFSAHDRNLPDQFADDVLDGRVDGVLLIAPPDGSPALRRIEESSLPYAVIAGVAQGPHFSVDDRMGVLLALDHLHSLGHRRIAHVSGRPNVHDSRTRENAFREFLALHELSPEASPVVPGNYWSDGGYAAGQAIAQMAQRPTAVFCANDVTAFGLLDAFANARIRVPEEISVVGFDDVPACATRHPGLTSVRQPIQSMASAAVRAVVDQIETGVQASGMIFAPQLIVRGSTAPPQQESFQ